ncbi:unnamed protein product [Pieris brassicae]|uniref:Uncharacterized protein n=1 Tax=Pieris brassicae TaxID=7116 RepID=A0A9P0TMH5_PIEBR|nr:unnamed protein product [Pieris brassicae]
MSIAGSRTFAVSLTRKHRLARSQPGDSLSYRGRSGVGARARVYGRCTTTAPAPAEGRCEAHSQFDLQNYQLRLFTNSTVIRFELGAGTPRTRRDRLEARFSFRTPSDFFREELPIISSGAVSRIRRHLLALERKLRVRRRCSDRRERRPDGGLGYE